MYNRLGLQCYSFNEKSIDKIARVNGYENRETLIKMVGSDINPE